jgi:hypothetical protein
MTKAFAALLVTGLAVFATPAAYGQCVKENINYYGTISSKYNATVRTPDGRYLSVPVINGMLPSIDEVTGCGVTTRTYSYYSGVKHVPGTIPTYHDRCTPSSPPVITATITRPTVTEYTEKKPYTYPAPSSTDSYYKTYYDRPPIVTESRSYNDSYYKPLYGGSSSNLDSVKKDIQELREKLDKLIDRYDKEKKSPVTLPAPSSTKDLDEAKAAIYDLKEEVKKLRALTMKYEEERKAKEFEKAPAPTPKEPPKVVQPPITLPAPRPDGMVKPSELGKKKE